MSESGVSSKVKQALSRIWPLFLIVHTRSATHKRLHGTEAQLYTLKDTEQMLK